MPTRTRAPIRTTVLAAIVLGLTACGTSAAPPPASSGEPGFPVTVATCGFDSTVPARPGRIVTLNQGATEVALALGVGDRMAGTAYLDDAVPEKWRAQYEKIPVLAAKYPTQEQVATVRPDLVYASYASAFKPAAAGERAALQSRGVASVLSPSGCPEKPERASWDLIWSELELAAKAFGVAPRATELREQQQAALADPALKTAAGKRILWWDSDLNSPFVGAGTGAPQLIMEAVGGSNLFAGLRGNWEHVSWENFVAADPDVIVLVDAKAYSAQQKIDRLHSDPATRTMRAVRENRLVTVPFSETTPGVRLVDGAQRVAAAIKALP